MIKTNDKIPHTTIDWYILYIGNFIANKKQATIQKRNKKRQQENIYKII